MMNIYCIKDTKAEITHTPFFNTHDVIAQRNVAITVNNPESTLHHYPEDYVLLKYGTFDDTNGEMKIDSIPKIICNLSTMVRE